jgi:hypothetical protein
MIVFTGHETSAVHTSTGDAQNVRPFMRDTVVSTRHFTSNFAQQRQNNMINTVTLRVSACGHVLHDDPAALCGEV